MTESFRGFLDRLRHPPFQEADMRAIGGVPALALTGLLVACSEPVNTPVETELRLSQHSMESHNFGAPLSGAGEVPAVDTRARGNARRGPRRPTPGATAPACSP